MYGLFGLWYKAEEVLGAKSATKTWRTVNIFGIIKGDMQRFFTKLMKSSF